MLHDVRRMSAYYLLKQCAFGSSSSTAMAAVAAVVDATMMASSRDCLQNATVNVIVSADEGKATKESRQAASPLPVAAKAKHSKVLSLPQKLWPWPPG